MPRVNLLIADDVGLGKTIEAGLVVQEMILRHRVRSVLIVCPSSLQLQWRDEMRDKFGLEFRIIDSESISQLRRKRGIHVNPWSHFPRLITSIDFLKRERPLRSFRETLPAGEKAAYPRPYDLLIVDEAHNVAPSGRGQYATESMRTLAIRSLTPHFEHKLFLSATPHNGYSESFAALLELLDNQRLARAVSPDRAQLDAVMVRRMKNELKLRWDGSRRFAERRVKPHCLRRFILTFCSASSTGAWPAAPQFPPKQSGSPHDFEHNAVTVSTAPIGRAVQIPCRVQNQAGIRHAPVLAVKREQHSFAPRSVCGRRQLKRDTTAETAAI
jgi:hypothetical protein